MTKPLSERLKETRLSRIKANGRPYSREDVSREIKCSTATINNVERGFIPGEKMRQRIEAWISAQK